MAKRVKSHRVARHPANSGVDRGALEGLVGYHLRRAQLGVFQDFAAAMAGIKVTPGQFGVLALIHANPRLCQSDLGLAMGVDRSTVVAVIDRLEARGWVERAPSATDGRRYALRLSAEGSRRLLTALKRVRQHEKRMTRRLNAAERALLIALLRRVG